MVDGPRASIEIHRKVRTTNAAGRYTVLIDDQEVAKLWIGNTVVVDVSPGTHVVSAKTSPFSKPQGHLQVTVGPNETIRINLQITGAVMAKPKLTVEKPAVVSAPRQTTPVQEDSDRPMSVRELSRLEVVIGEETREIDNSKGVSPIVRTFKISREWTRSYTVDAERATTTTGGVGLDAQVVSVKAQVETALRAHYSTSNQDRRTFEDEVTITAAPHTRSRVMFIWKEIHQVGVVEFQSALALTRVPFEVVVGLTFDQQQDDGA